MPQANRMLVRLFRRGFLRYFENPVLGPHTPFWRSLHPATEPQHWGLRPEESKILESLGPAIRVDPTPYPFQALGSLGAKKGCLWFVCFRPSFSTDYLKYYSFHLGPYGKKILSYDWLK